LKLTWYFNWSSFPVEHANSIKENFQKAAKNWSDTCNVKFRAVQDRKDAVFIISWSEESPEELPVNNKNNAESTHDIARAFFPWTKKENRVLYVYKAYLTSIYDKIGIFRHEIGHILGFQHAWLGENKDAESVMNYVGKEVAHKFELSTLDQKHSREIYPEPGKQLKEELDVPELEFEEFN